MAPRNPGGEGGVAAPGAPARPDESLLRTLQQIVADVPGLLSDRVLLLSLEMRRAKAALGQIIGLVVAALVLALTAWFALWTGVILAAVAYGVHWYWVILGAFVFNLVACVLALNRAKSLGPLLALPATVRRLTLAPTPDPNPAPDLDGEGKPT